MTATTTLCLIRHGETDWNAERRIQGQVDIPLNATGESQARAAARGLAGQSFAAVYSSDLARAWQTAAAILAGRAAAAHIFPALRERHYGVLQSLTMSEAESLQPLAYRRHVARDPHYDLDGGESLGDFAQRVMDGLEALVRGHAGQTVLAVTHGGVLDIAYRHATGRGLEGRRDFPVANAAFNWLERDADAWRVLSWADRRHLDVALDELPASLAVR